MKIRLLCDFSVLAKWKYRERETAIKPFYEFINPMRAKQP